MSETRNRRFTLDTNPLLLNPVTRAPRCRVLPSGRDDFAFLAGTPSGGAGFVLNARARFVLGRLQYIRGERAPFLFTFARAEALLPPAPLYSRGRQASITSRKISRIS